MRINQLSAAAVFVDNSSEPSRSLALENRGVVIEDVDRWEISVGLHDLQGELCGERMGEILKGVVDQAGLSSQAARSFAIRSSNEPDSLGCRNGTTSLPEPLEEIPFSGREYVFDARYGVDDVRLCSSSPNEEIPKVE